MTVRIGAFCDKDDPSTMETAITLSGADQAELLKHTGGVVDISGRTWAAITSCDGHYDLSLLASDVDTLGHLTIVVQDADVCLPVRKEYAVVDQNYWDSKYGTDKRQVDTVEVSGATPVTAVDVAMAVLDRLLSEHEITGSAGKGIADAAAGAGGPRFG